MNKGLRILLVFVLLTVPTISFAATEYNVYTWGYSDILHGILQAISEFLGSNGFASAFKIAASMGLLAVFGVLLSGKPVTGYDILLRVMMIMVISTVLTLHNARVNIIDVEEGVQGAANVKTIDNVPVYIGLPLNMLSSMEYNLREAFRTSLNKGLVAEGITSLNNMSVIKALNILQAGISFRMHDPNFAKTFNSFMENCVMPDIYTGYIDPVSLTDSTYSFWHILKTATEQGARIGENYLDKTDGGATIASCQNLYDSLDREFTSVAAANGEAGQQLAASLGIASSTSVMNILGAGSQLFLGLQTTSSDFLTNNMAMNMFNDAYTMAAQGLGVSQEGLAWGTAKAQETMKMTSIMQGINAKKYLPIAKGYLTVIFVAIIPIVILIGLAMGQVAKPISMVFGILLALALWGIGEQILDFIILLRSKGLLTQENGYTLASQAFVNQGILDTISLSLGMYWMIPTLAFSVATMSGYAATSMMSGISGIAGAGVSGAAGEAATGSATMGNIRTNTFSSNKFDAARDVAIGTNTSIKMDRSESAKSAVVAEANRSLQNIDKTQDSKTGTVMWRDEKTGNLYRAMGNMTNTSGRFEIDGMIQNLTTGKEVKGSVSGFTKDMDSKTFGDKTYADASGHFGMSQNELKNLGNVKGEGLTFMDDMHHVDFKGSASDIITQDKIRTANTREESVNSVKYGYNGEISGDSIILDGEQLGGGSVKWDGNKAVISTTKDGRDYSAVVDNAKVSIDENGNISVIGDNVRSQGIGGHSISDDNTKKSTDGEQITHLGNGIEHKNALQTVMGGVGVDSQNTAWAKDFMEMKRQVRDGKMSEDDYQSKLTEFAAAISKDLTPLYNKQAVNQNNVDVTASAEAGVNIAGNGAGIKYSIGVSGSDRYTQDEVTRHLVNVIDRSVDQMQSYADAGLTTEDRAPTGVVNNLQREISSMMNIDLTTSTTEFVDKRIKH